jgi:hypothetical protein
LTIVVFACGLWAMDYSTLSTNPSSPSLMLLHNVKQHNVKVT